MPTPSNEPSGASSPLGESVLVAETGLGRLQLVARTTGAAFLIDEPRAVGGLGSGPTPYDLLSAALGACTVMTLRLYAERKGWPLGRVQVSVLHHRASLAARDLFERTITLEGPLDEAQRARLLEIAERCPVHQTLDRGSDVRTTLTAAPAAEPSASGAPEHMRDMEEAGAA
jgi:putative redox protein